MVYGKLYLIPNNLGNLNTNFSIESQISVIENIDHFIFENEKPGRALIKNILPSKEQSKLEVYTLNKHSLKEEKNNLLKPCLNGIDMGLISDAGCPAIADPGSEIVKKAHSLGIRVIPFVGPSSIFMALMSSGMNGQSFKFNGYLPINKNERKSIIKKLEKNSITTTQIFMETPYRNNKLFSELLKILNSSTKLCVACDITHKSEYIKTKSINDWKKRIPDLNKRPTIFLIESE